MEAVIILIIIFVAVVSGMIWYKEGWQRGYHQSSMDSSNKQLQRLNKRMESIDE